MKYFYKYLICSVILVCFLFTCHQKNEFSDVKRIIRHEMLANISSNWVLKKHDSLQHNYQLLNAKKLQLQAGEIVSLGFNNSKHLEYIEITSDDNECSFALYIDEKYAGKFISNQKVGVNKSIKSIRFLIVNTSGKMLVKGWDEQFNYAYIKDTTVRYSENQLINLKMRTDVEFLPPANPEKKRMKYFAKTLKFERCNFVDRKSVLELDEKNGRYTYKQIADIKSNGMFFIHRQKIDHIGKIVIYDYFYSGSWVLLNRINQNYKLRLIGKLSGKLADNEGDRFKFYQLFCLIDSLGIIHSKELVFDKMLIDLPDWAMVNVSHFNSQFIVNIPYSTTKNITGIQLYPCNKCYLRYHTIKDLLKAQQIFAKRGLKIKLLDCYRPRDVQQVLYDAFPVSGYVADPVGGSIHNRGTAVDLTLVDSNEKELDMGTQFDDLTFKSNHGYIGFSDTILQNRRLLRETMNACNFVTIRLEWWHYNHVDARKYPKFNDPFPCNSK